MSDIPIILLALANDNEHKHRKLSNLTNEAAAIHQGLQSAIEGKLCEVVTLKNTTIDDILSTFSNPEYKNRISIFHYAGHADGYQLLLETADQKNEVARGEGLVSYLSRQDSLQLIFLNGCSTEQQADDLITAGTPAVIGTSKSIKDNVAMKLASRFYKSIGSGSTLKSSWLDAIDEVKISHSKKSLRSFGDEEDEFEVVSDRYPWELKIRDGAEQANQWNLPDASNNPLFKLPKIAEKYYQSLPDSPFRYLKYYNQEDAATFFGRGYEIRDLYEALQQRQTPITLLHGKSGVGKSSLLYAGLIPRIEKKFTTIYARRDDKLGLTKTLTLLLTGEKEGDLIVHWKQREKQSKKPLLVILDQVEEYETKAIDTIKDELGDLFNKIKSLFKPSNALKGQILLAYRKEFHVDIEKRLKERYLPYSSISLEPLNRNGIIEVVQGLAKHETTKNYYQYSVEGLDDGSENNLAAIIAEDLLEDKNSPVASLLQIHLSKLWSKINPKKGEKVHFDVANYQEIGKSNLDDFFKEQISKIETVNPQVVKSGLALEILQEHTTEFATAKLCENKVLEDNYHHCTDIKLLQQQLVDCYLLSKLLSKKNIESTVLAHDTLGVIVLSHYSKSDQSAQRTRRILSNKTSNIEAEETIDNVLDEHDLTEVEAGLNSTKKLTEIERKLLEKSWDAREQREKARKRRKRLGISAVTTIAGVAVVATIFYFKADTERTRAIKQINNANELIGYVQSDLREKLQEVNRLNIMDDVQAAIDTYNNSSADIVTGTTNSLVRRNRRQTVKNDVDRADNLFQKGKTMEALNIYLASLDKIKKISSEIPNNAEYLSNIGVLNLKIATVFHMNRRDKEAYPLIIEALDLSKKLSKQYPEKRLFKRDVVSAYESLGNLYHDNSHYDNALINYNKALSISKNLLNSDKNSNDYNKLNIIFLEKIANTYSKINATSKAIDLINSYDKSKLPSNLIKEFDKKSKTIKQSCGKRNCLDMVIENHIKALNLSKNLSDSNPQNNIFYIDFINIYNNISSAYLAKNDLHNASIYSEKFINGSKEVLRRNPLHIHHKYQLAKAYEGLADINRRKKKFKKSRNIYNESIFIMKSILKTNPNNQSWKIYLHNLETIKNSLDTSEKVDILINKRINNF